MKGNEALTSVALSLHMYSTANEVAGMKLTLMSNYCLSCVHRLAAYTVMKCELIIFLHLNLVFTCSCRKGSPLLMVQAS